MKRHLFYTFLTIFILTAGITLLGITDIIAIREQYLTPLFSALLIELVGAVIALYKVAKFFDDDASPQLQPLNTHLITKASPEEPVPSATIVAKVPEIEGREQDLAQYFQSLRDLEGRFHESEKLRKDTNGRRVYFRGVVYSVNDFNGYPGITLNSFDAQRMEVVIVKAAKGEEAAAYSLQKGDVVRATGVAITTGLHPSSVLIEDATFARVNVDSV